ncbi:MAG: hypothetical protein KAW83_02555 [Dehalococcoidia bacterium]|nr:hypothetical protein [Dehalococcoidia bacterium]
MSDTSLGIVNIVVVVLLVISMFFPYQRFDIAIEYSTIIRIIMAVVVLGMGVRLLVHTGYFATFTLVIISLSSGATLSRITASLI